MSAFFASVQESAAALLRRCFIASQASASHLLKVALQRLFGADWFEELKKAADETSLPFIYQKPDGPWDVYTVFDMLLGVLPRLLQESGWKSSDPQRIRDCEALMRHVQFVYSTRNWWAHRPVSIEEACTAAECVGDTLLALRLMLGAGASAAADCSSAVHENLKLLRSPSSTVEWQVDEVAFVLLVRGFSALCEGAHAVVWQCRKLQPDVDHVEYCHPCRQQICQCTCLNVSDVKRGDKKNQVSTHLTGSSCTRAKTCAELVLNCLHDVGPLISHLKRCRKCMPSAPDKELDVVKTVRNLMFHSSKKELVSLVLSTLMCIEVVTEQMRCGKHEKVSLQGKLRDMQVQLQAFAQFPDVADLADTAAAAIRTRNDFTKCPSLPNASVLTAFDVVKHVLFGSVPLPVSGCSCFNDVNKWLTSGNLGIVKSVLKDPTCVSGAAYSEVRTAAPSSASLTEVSGKLHSRFTSNTAAVDGSKAAALDVKFCQELEKLAGAPPSPAVPSSAAGIASLLSCAGQRLWEPGAPLCAFAQSLHSKGHDWLLLQHVVFSGDLSDGVANCDCVVKQDCKDARLVFVKEKLKSWKGKALADALPLVATTTVHLAELAQVHGATLKSSHASVCVHLPDSSLDSKFLPIKLDPLLVARGCLVNRCCSSMWAAVNSAGKRQCVLLHGISGVGKTCAAVAAVCQLQRVAKDKKCTMLIQLISGHSAATVRVELVKFGRALSRRLRLGESANDDEVIRKLTAHLKDTRYAIFVDDANEEGLEVTMRLLPVSKEGCTIIATSRLMNEVDGCVVRRQRLVG